MRTGIDRAPAPRHDPETSEVEDVRDGVRATIPCDRPVADRVSVRLLARRPGTRP
ncbi:hypothetical protein GCM10010289_27750 [Streptomyces violascens]|nr:hypothetical protein GCM10010289_27750 [Streptomyces violascens]